MHLEGLIEQASRHVLPAEDGHQQTAQPLPPPYEVGTRAS